MLKHVPVPPPEQLTARGRQFAYPEGPGTDPAAMRDAEKRYPLQPQLLLDAARGETGLSDFGPDPFMEPLTRLCDSIEREVDLNVAGREAAYKRLMNLLVTRLRLQDLWTRHPQILELPVEAPIFIVGLPRSGTTFLQRLMARDSTLRWPPFWELMFPLPFGQADAPVTEPDPRIAAAQAALDRLFQMAPEMVKMHEIEAEEPEEEIALLSLGFSSMAFEWSFAVPSYVDYYKNVDHTEGYAYFKRVLQTLQWLRGGGQWLLKAPMHMENLEELLTVFPDAVIVQTHRDAVTTTVSLSSLTCTGIRNYFDHPNPLVVGSYISAAVERLLLGIDGFRQSHPQQPIVDIQFRELMADPISMVRRIYAVCGKTLTPQDEALIQQWLDAHPRAKHGGHEYSADDFGIDLDERYRKLAFYLERYQVPIERRG